MNLPQLAGFREFISCWIYKSDALTFVVDPGPSSTIPTLIKALDTLNIESIDYILLTHIHLDHGGGTGHLLHSFPDAQVNCHPRGIPHLIDPADLWKGSLNVLGKVAEAYGPIIPVSDNQISYKTKIKHNGKEINIIETPGHASHHICYQMDGYLFAAEVAGVSIPVEDGYYQRLATPVRFINDVYQESLRRVISLPERIICFGHHGLRNDPQNVFSIAQKQLDLWIKIVKKHLAYSNGYDEQMVFEELIELDPALALFHRLDEDIQQREKYFSLNSIQGIAGYLKAL